MSFFLLNWELLTHKSFKKVHFSLSCSELRPKPYLLLSRPKHVCRLTRFDDDHSYFFLKGVWQPACISHPCHHLDWSVNFNATGGHFWSTARDDLCLSGDRVFWGLKTQKTDTTLQRVKLHYAPEKRFLLHCTRRKTGSWLSVVWLV